MSFLYGVTGHRPAFKLGRCTDGAERGKGTVVHALIVDSDGTPTWEALCGAMPGARSAGWGLSEPLTQYTCKQCVAFFKRKRKDSDL